ncbi:MAG: Histidine triad (HIT) protein [Candidatus Nomurabacteria bacterium GW2011_GWF2_35_66]|uniref:Histidine triad (HIT) protein n=1 Tax=Candidatus Nomurabacteria bacterium GW2011_GWE1_35_16 TaxID=1618761 RepID=A0A0G0DU05_9BACT|nr:MAG: Histidine triad (HIT) protein [Candidatus Nomurabacteria bacterium GW2011_GWF1_34_20]KKP63302.1 MAG: Histidine triad (HIT) protein [Candidatus Nomurabacteria bacterium GW2011_GWE2_34_25]KKP66500.1 MAG: Histidine triad (HIT) protein [Candidatus Nomurabacteria bacterium GW2011_GWE1_35_16]KKP83702.1 MAG: Histidine triad (HIT) protein [Candidatus Nomurabacteria bacterium GW2011_GWF2_35_66]HAE36936.1 diadenosine tetraphosphate hydrolase [Candidatus Nomurabacteria bacterium]
MTKYEAKTKDNKCVFCEIVEGRFQTPGIFWEDDNFMAFLSIDPNTEGFSVVIPKKHFDGDVLKMPNEELSLLTLASKKVAQILENFYKDVGRVGIIMEGMGVNHAHVKLSPMHGTEKLKDGTWTQALSPKDVWFDKYEGYLSSAGGPMADFNKLKELAENIKNSTKNDK